MIVTNACFNAMDLSSAAVLAGMRRIFDRHGTKCGEKTSEFPSAWGVTSPARLGFIADEPRWHGVDPRTRGPVDTPADRSRWIASRTVNLGGNVAVTFLSSPGTS